MAADGRAGGIAGISSNNFLYYEEGKFLPTGQEQADRLVAEVRRAAEQARRTEDAEAENERLRAEIDALRAEAGKEQ